MPCQNLWRGFSMVWRLVMPPPFGSVSLSRLPRCDCCRGKNLAFRQVFVHLSLVQQAPIACFGVSSSLVNGRMIDTSLTFMWANRQHHEGFDEGFVSFFPFGKEAIVACSRDGVGS
jgi:hypothetical protein